jgi:hypothetical protein
MNQRDRSSNRNRHQRLYPRIGARRHQADS